MKIFLPVYDNGEDWSDHYKNNAEICFKTKEGASKWIESRGYVKSSEEIWFPILSLKCTGYYSQEDEDNNCIFDFYDRSYYYIQEIEVRE